MFGLRCSDYRDKACLVSMGEQYFLKQKNLLRSSTEDFSLKYFREKRILQSC